MTKLRVALIGAGVIGRAHVRGAAHTTDVELAGIADPSPAARALAAEFGIPWFAGHRQMLEQVRPDGAIIAVPNSLHVPIALECLVAGLPVLVEKPIADTVKEGRRLAQASERSGVPVLVGHHRRHNPILRRAREIVQAGTLGRLVAANVLAAVLKPDAYFDVAWRREPGGGPILINLSHEIDLLRFVCGEVVGVQALTANAIRGFPVEDTVATLLRFSNGALATIALTDAAVSPWIWDQATGENPAFPRSEVETHFLCGTEASLSLPSLRLWRYPGRRGWDQTFQTEQRGVPPADPYTEQMRHFGAVIRGEEAPVTSAADATRTLEIIFAVKQAALTGELVTLNPS